MNVQSIIDYLEEYKTENGDCIVANGWYNSDSYRGYYQELAVEPADFPVTIETLINTLRDSIGETFQGYKGGEYMMEEDSTVFYASYGCTGPEITKAFLKNYVIEGNSELSDWETEY